MSLVEEWQEIGRSLPDNWGEARLRLIVENDADRDRAAALLGPLTPGRRAKELIFSCGRRGAGPSPELVRRLLQRLDEEGIGGTLELVSAREAEQSPAPARRRLADEWDAELAKLPPDWSDLYAELHLDSTDFLERAALLTAPLNPARFGDEPAFRFRCARRFGYGASPGMVRRCLERLDGAGMTGRLTILHALSDTDPVSTQGPVWYIGGKVV